METAEGDEVRYKDCFSINMTDPKAELNDTVGHIYRLQ